MSRRILLLMLALSLASLRVPAQTVAPVPLDKLIFKSAQKTAAAMKANAANCKNCAAEAPIQAMLQVKAPPKVGQPVTLLLSVLPQQTLNNFNATWDADAAVTLVNAPQARAAFPLAKKSTCHVSAHGFVSRPWPLSRHGPRHRTRAGFHGGT